jgi:hypothetical protein
MSPGKRLGLADKEVSVYEAKKVTASATVGSP